MYLVDFVTNQTRNNSRNTFIIWFPSHGQRTHANGKTAKKRQLLPFKFRKYAAVAQKQKKDSRKNVKKKISKTKQKKLARPKQKVKKKKKD